MSFINTLNDFRYIYDSRFNNLVIYAVGMGIPYDQAKDIVQECFIKLWENHSNISNPTAYLFTAVRNSSLNWLANSKNSPSRKVELNEICNRPVDESTIEEATEYFRKVEEAYEKIQQLSGRCKDIFIMAYIEHMKIKDIAQELDLSENTVKTYLKRAKEILHTIAVIITGIIIWLI